MKKIILGCIALLFSMQSHADTIGVWGGSFSTWDSFISNAGHSAVAVNSGSVLTDLDQVWLIRTTGSNNLTDYVNNGGTLITEWNGSQWAANTANLLNVTDTGGGVVASNTQVTFTQAGLDIGLGDETGNPYANAGATEFFRTFSDIGAGVDVIATANGTNVGLAGESGLGFVALLGWDWQDGASDSITQTLVNDIIGITSVSIPAVPVPAAVWLFGTALIGFVGMSRRRKVS